MFFRWKSTDPSFVRLRVTPDPEQAALLERKMSALNYYPTNGFHRDLKQGRQTRAMGRRAAVSRVW